MGATSSSDDPTPTSVPAPSAVDVDRQAGITLTWPDGRTTRVDLVELRAVCPCAECRGLRERGEAPPGVGPATELVDAELVGGWGLGLRWADGHSTGIYPWELLARWPDAAGGS